MNLLILLLRRSRGSVALAVCFGLLTGAASAGLIAHINGVLARGGAISDQGTVLGFATLGVLMLGSRIGSQLLLTRLQTNTTFALRDQLSQRILATPLRRLEELGSHRLLATLVDDIQAVTQGLLCIPPLLINGGIILGCMTYLAVMSRLVFAALLVFALLGAVSYLLPLRHIMALLKDSRQTNDRFFRDLRSLTQGLKELKLHQRRRTAFLDQELFPTAETLKQLQQRVSTLHALSTSWGMSLFFFFIGLLLFALPGIAPVSASTLVGYTLAVLYLQQPLDASMTLLPMLGAGTVALRHIEALELPNADTESTPVAIAPPATPSRIDLVGVTHAYRREGEDLPFTLGPIDLTLRPGEILFIVGGNGSGKTTLAKLITGLYSPESGAVHVDGQPVTDDERERYRQRFATVFSDFHLFDSLLGLTVGGQADKARAYLARLQLERKVRIDASGALSTTDLSSGQRKRLALLTAFLEDRPVYLFDEWAADQDPLFKEVFYRELLPDLKSAGKAVVVISHDDRYFDVADHLLRLESGAVASGP
ncbi:cyclic peptide export ABC transporter [Myxococcus sp. SDU36]|uniref:cyclic peptide export ABC transporter n=1 Tax=Myxococcus sp. SDU36 TaxID=2831967 RepID=UPI002543A76F|nr:cyclic peptide export ABC transporter [Myxococcus sp. SDU36]WIG97186.1 cyclic peptide export ABC transporter [Myxococcus sp. SDU36]